MHETGGHPGNGRDRRPPLRSSTCALGALLLLLGIGACGGDDPVAVATTGTLAIEVVGLPNTADAGIDVRGPDGFEALVHGDTLLSGLTPGTYALTAPSNLIGDLLYDAQTQAQEVAIERGLTATARVSYFGRTARARLGLRVEGLPAGVAAAITVRGPAAFEHAVDSSDTLADLEPGTYAVLAEPVDVGPDTWSASPAREDLDLTAAEFSTVSITYALPDPDAVDLSVAGVEWIQAVQRADGGVPLVADRAALLRVGVVADSETELVPAVRITLSLDGRTVLESTPSRPATLVGTSVERSSLESTWNVEVPADLVRPGLGVRVTVDPAGTVPESDETNNRWPTDAPAPATVVEVGPLPLRLVPVEIPRSGLSGRVDAGNAASYVTMAEEIFPFANVDASVAPVLVSDREPLEADNANGAWYDVLGDVLAARTAEGSDAYHYGVVQTDYAAGVAGMGFVSFHREGGPNTAIGWDRSGSRAEVLAHELGHNLGRSHAPCGGPSDADPDYPHTEARIGAWGYDARALRLVDPTSAYDIMSYCRPQWVSDYTFLEILDFAAPAAPDLVLATAMPTAGPVPSARQDCLLITGRSVDGRLELDPVLRVRTRPRLPARAGPHTVVVVDDGGIERTRLEFTLEDLGCEGGRSGVFAWAVPTSILGTEALGSVRLRGPSDRVLRVATGALTRSGAAPPFALRAVRPGRLRVDWDPERHPLVLVRDVEGGAVLGLLRSGSAEIVTEARRLQLNFSDGVRTEVHLTDRD